MINQSQSLGFYYKDQNQSDYKIDQIVQYLKQQNTVKITTIQILCSYIRAAKFYKLLTSMKINSIFITTLNLSFCQLSGQYLQIIKGADFKFLKNLDLSGNLIVAKDIKLLINANWTFLKRIDFTFNKIGNQGLSYLMKCNWLKTIEYLNLSETYITNSGIQILTRGNWAKVIWINLSNNDLSFISSNTLSCINFAAIKRLLLNQLPLSANFISNYRRLIRDTSINIFSKFHHRFLNVQIQLIDEESNTVAELLDSKIKSYSDYSSQSSLSETAEQA